MPLSYHGFAPAAILLMLLCLVGKHLYDLWQARRLKNKY